MQESNGQRTVNMAAGVSRAHAPITITYYIFDVDIKARSITGIYI